jgi:hypothetical protein
LEFQDEMISWIGHPPDENEEAYASRSGITTVPNLLTPIYVCHGETDIQVPSIHARIYYEKAKSLNKYVRYLELKGVGDERHWGNITQEQILQKQQFEKEALKKHAPPVLPEEGEFIVAGYLVTKQFSVFMESIDDVGLIDYHIPSQRVDFIRGSGKVIWKEE